MKLAIKKIGSSSQTIILGLIFLIVLVVAVIYITKTVKENHEKQDEQKKMDEIFHPVPEGHSSFSFSNSM